MKEINITLETITPLWTGDAWGNNTEIKPQAIMGSLRFWFEVYCHAVGIEVKEYNTEKVDENKLKKYLLEHVQEKKDTLINDALNKEQGISLPSIIFGCTGWKSQIWIKKIENETIELNKDKINYKCLKDSEFWINKSLFNNNNQITLFSNVSIALQINPSYIDEFKSFLKFYSDKIILVGGKKSFGFGFCRINSDIDLSDVKEKDIQNNVFSYKETGIKISNDGNQQILGFNFKYYQRLKEQTKNNRKKYFGTKKNASLFYYSNLVNNSIHIIGFNPCDENNKFDELFNNYSNFEEE